MAATPILVRIVDQPIDWLGVVQAVGSIAAIIAGFAVVVIQQAQRDRERRLQQQEMAQSAGDLARQSIVLVLARLESALASIKTPTLFALRGHRTTEMVNAMRELEVQALPAILVSSFAAVRGGIYAVNARISDVYETEKSAPQRKKVRAPRLDSTGRVLKEVLSDFEQLRAVLQTKFKIAIEPVLLPPLISDFVVQSQGRTSSPREAID